MSQHYILNKPIRAMRFTTGTSLDDLAAFISGRGVNIDGSDVGPVSLIFNVTDDEPETVQLEEDDFIVDMGGELDVYPYDHFHAEFTEVCQCGGI